MPRTADRTDIPRRLIEAGYVLFARHGYHATGIQQITDEAGVPKGSFYNHFDSKEAFAVAIIQHHGQWVDEAWERCLSDAPAPAAEAIRHVFTRFAAHHEQRGCQGCLVGNFSAEVSETSVLCRDALNLTLSGWRARLTTLLRRAQAEGSVRTDVPPDALATFFWDAWEGALLRMKVEHHPQALKDTVALLLDHLLRP